MKLLVVLVLAVALIACASTERDLGEDWSIIKSPSGRCYETYRIGFFQGSLGAVVPCP